MPTRPWEKHWKCHRVEGKLTSSINCKELFLERCMDARTEEDTFIDT